MVLNFSFYKKIVAILHINELSFLTDQLWLDNFVTGYTMIPDQMPQISRH